MSIINALSTIFPHQPNSQQKELFIELDTFIRDKDADACFILKGYAGTGKTTVVSTLVNVLKELRIGVVMLAPTGRAAKVLSSYAHLPASTIHRKIYRKKAAANVEMQFSLAPNLHKRTFFIVDEASMIADERNEISGSTLLEDLVTFVYNEQGNKIIFIGDVAQLPPVNSEESPALSSSYMSSFGLNIREFELTDVVRQSQKSGILYNATQIREQIKNPDNVFPSLITAGYKDVYRMPGDKIIEGLNYSYDKYGEEDTLVICRSNKSANIYNQHIRNQILWREDEITGGDLIMVVKNNYYWSPEDKGGFIANGEIARITRVKKIHEMYGCRFADVQIQFLDADENYSLDCKVLLDTIYTNHPGLPYEEQKRFYYEVLKDYEDLPYRKKVEEIKNNPFYNALHIKFAYAVTCHKAQGGQWSSVFIDQGFLTDEMLTTDLFRWLYTATTRATKELFYVNFNEKFFPL